ncbi:MULTISPECIES: AAA-like domain-containing protein [unclassified Microcystis]|uniref:AAA-like domain-containing protein n=1 Tax=unclassified Microcystis TaxID=2643300 RepID=UPI002589391B|nr:MULTISPECIES: AAA-like domain-containing protein [unclassified Microcystis]MCA2673200.1 AAA-like domain-containing protein [Microcystis sp. M080S2]MCA2735444.1 AAA-like domain-containing protein [Microcystis sp. M158S2]MCA2753807.1 AAA-like domain-containing protein [Microcystis sp. M137S2]MCA2764539.1 AAA-like domain-containing protein [Microcystis sp. M151S2]
MGRSLKVKSEYIPRVKQALKRNGYATQQLLAEELGFARSTLNLFLNGKSISNLNFYEICQKLALDYREIADWDELEETAAATSEDEGENRAADLSKYVERPPVEQLCLETVSQAGSLLRIKSAKGMGKTLLVDRILSQVDKREYKTVSLSFLQASKGILGDLDRLLSWFALIISKKLGLANLFEEKWQEGLGIYSCTAYFEDHLLKKLDKPLILVLEEIDSLFVYASVADDFLSLFRLWHEEAKNNNTWQKLHLIITYSTENYVPADLNTSPLINVGTEILLPDFTPEQVLTLANKYQANLGKDELQKIINLVGGHPYLIQKALYAITQKQLSLADFEQTAATEAGIYGDHLRGHLLNLQEHPNLAAGMKKVVESSSPVDLGATINWQLHSLGLVNFVQNAVQPRYPLYSDYFRYRLSA